MLFFLVFVLPKMRSGSDVIGAADAAQDTRVGRGRVLAGERSDASGVAQPRGGIGREAGRSEEDADALDGSRASGAASSETDDELRRLAARVEAARREREAQEARRAEIEAREEPTRPTVRDDEPVVAGRDGADATRGRPAAGAAATGPNRMVTLVLESVIHGQKLDGNDAQTWARLAYFFQQESPVQHFLVYPGGSIPVPQPPAGTNRPLRPVSPTGDPSQPRYRLVIGAEARPGKDVTFYGRTLAQSVECRIACRIEELRDGEYVAISTATAAETASPAEGQDAATFARQVYDATLEKLAGELAKKAPFTSR